MFNWIVSVRVEYLKPFNCVQTNELKLIQKCYLQTICLQIIYITEFGIKKQHNI